MMAFSRRSLLNAGAWTIGGHVATQLIRFGSNLVLARLLLPDAFGVAAVASVFWVTLSMLTDVGLNQIIIRSERSEDAKYLNTVWIIQVLQGGLVAGLLFVGATAVDLLQVSKHLHPASTYGHPSLPVAIEGFAAACVLQSLASTKWALATKRLQVGRVVFIEVGCQCIAAAAMFAWAQLDPSIHALVIGAICSAAARTSASHFLLDGPSNSLSFSAAAAKEVFGFGRWVFVSSGITVLASNLDKILLGWIAPAETVGVYSIASQIVLALHDVVNRVASRVGYPALSAVYRSKPSDLTRTYYKARLPADVYCFSLAAFLMICGDIVIAQIYPQAYADAGVYLAILGISLIGVRYFLLTQVYLAIGKAPLIIFEQVVKLASMIGGMWLGLALFGIPGAIGGISFSYIFGAGVNALLVGRPLGIWNSFRELLALPLMLAGLLAGTAIRFALEILTG